MKKVKQKKMLGATLIGAGISAISSLIGTAINNNNQRSQVEAQQRKENINNNITNANNYMNNLNQVINADTDWAYDKFRPTFKCGGKRRLKANLGKYKSRFDK